MNSHPVLIVLAIAVAAPLLAEIPIGACARRSRPRRLGAGMLSVLLFPTFAGVLLSRIARTAPTALT